MSVAEQVQIEHGLHAAAGVDQYLTFMLDGEEYGVDILRVQEIRGWERTTPIPNTPDYVKGVINLRGAVVPIIDLRQRFGLADCAYGPTTVVIVLKVFGGDRERVMGVVVDAVSEVYNIPAETLQPTPDFGGAVDVEYVKGLATMNEKMVIVLDIERLLTSGELDIQSPVAQ